MNSIQSPSPSEHFNVGVAKSFVSATFQGRSITQIESDITKLSPREQNIVRTMINILQDPGKAGELSLNNVDLLKLHAKILKPENGDSASKCCGCFTGVFGEKPLTEEAVGALASSIKTEVTAHEQANPPTELRNPLTDEPTTQSELRELVDTHGADIHEKLELQCRLGYNATPPIFRELFSQLRNELAQIDKNKGSLLPSDVLNRWAVIAETAETLSAWKDVYERGISGNFESDSEVASNEKILQQAQNKIKEAAAKEAPKEAGSSGSKRGPITFSRREGVSSSTRNAPALAPGPAGLAAAGVADRLLQGSRRGSRRPSAARPPQPPPAAAAPPPPPPAAPAPPPSQVDTGAGVGFEMTPLKKMVFESGKLYTTAEIFTALKNEKYKDSELYQIKDFFDKTQSKEFIIPNDMSKLDGIYGNISRANRKEGVEAVNRLLAERADKRKSSASSSAPSSPAPKRPNPPPATEIT